MRTTVTLDDDLVKKVKDFAHRSGASFKVALNMLVSRGLASQERRQGARGRFRVLPHQGGFVPGVDVARLNQLVDQLEANDFVRKERRGR